MIGGGLLPSGMALTPLAAGAGLHCMLVLETVVTPPELLRLV